MKKNVYCLMLDTVIVLNNKNEQCQVKFIVRNSFIYNTILSVTPMFNMRMYFLPMFYVLAIFMARNTDV